MTDDPRDRRDGIGWVTRAIFGDERLRLGVAAKAAGLPPGHRTVARYAVVPSVDRAKFLLPLASRRVGAASTLAYNALRPPRVRANRLAVGVLAGLGVTGLARMPVLTVAAPTDADPAELLLTAHLARVEGRPLHAAIGIRPPDPHHKPTLQLFDGRGAAWAYAKVGWNDATRAMVRAEADALRAAPRAGGDLPAVPRLLRELAWGNLAVTLVEPMPAGVRRLPRPDRPELAAMLAVARRGGPPAAPRPLAGSPFLADLTARARRAGGPVGAALAALVERDGATTLEFGHWHGDWVPWNLGTHRGRLVAWDWENSGPGRPVGFDLAHQAFQSALSLRGRPVPEATADLVAVLDRYGDRLGLDPTRRRLVADAYLVELWLRTAELAAGGGGWSDRLHPALLHVLADRLGSPRE
ncbi:MULTISPECIES: hypothetical protein [Micromonospora]|uniref:Aminoglycoside phosphotransferase domain-containing protein n=1 Tax=Micromonospora solifontis TaxID=2487138 RepID=A0ABX9WJP0_9ACTN|nr:MULTISPECIES: hypothetical protein [Micromonospora]NES13470.1 hypothetical protein [Micromonospora sp. PPF5-17B]NES35594.1 hypothetical protein [Micromonospora solifontis]NES55514.1 hypothetical protein [Micromonospora sp. PPF5-6]RNM00480.1 hypothetical protein EFE23_05375 [Micromonospora solifontis]